MGRTSRTALRLALIICNSSASIAQRAAIVHESTPGRLWSLPSLRTRASTAPPQSSPEDLLHLALGKTETRRPSPLPGQLLSSPSHPGLSTQPHKFLFAADVVEDGLVEPPRLRSLD